MTPERLPQKKLSRGKAKERRRKLAERRRDVSHLNQQITEIIEGRKRLAEIGTFLSTENSPLSVLNLHEQAQTRAELEIEEIWLKFKLGMITQAEQQHDLSQKFDTLEKGMPDVYKSLIDNTHGPSRAQEIRRKVLPPTLVAGYYTKR